MLALSSESPPIRLQRTFAEAILSGDAPIPATIREASGPAHASRFSVYRNNAIAGLINAISVRYPVVRKLLWDDAFNRVAHQYVVSEPPRSPVLLQYGENFPQFLRGIGQGAAANYLADVAEIESARTRAYHAAEAAPLSREAFNAVPADEWPELRIALHPSVALLKSRFPVVSIWRTNLYANDNTLDVWRPECALIARPHLQVDVHIVSADVHDFITALADGQTVGAAIAQASAKAPDFDLAGCFNALISADIVVGLEHRRSSCI
jgi:hypothetical protein